MRVAAPAGGMLAVLVVVVMREVRCRCAVCGGGVGFWGIMNAKSDYGRRMGVPLLDISCALVSSLVYFRPYHQTIGISSRPRQVLGARGTLTLLPVSAPASSRRHW
jgi:hypothetical protein